MTRLSSFSALPGALVKTIAFFRQNLPEAAVAGVLPGLAAIFLTYQTGLVLSTEQAAQPGLYLLTFAVWYGATALSHASLFRLSLRGKSSGILGYRLGGDEWKLAASWGLIFFLLIIAGGIGLVVFSALLGAVAMVSRSDAGLTPEDPVETGNVPQVFEYFTPTEWAITGILGAVFALLLLGFAGRLLLAPAASIARRKVQALSVMKMTRKRGWAVVLGAIILFIPAGLMVHGFGLVSENLFGLPIHQPGRLFHNDGLVGSLILYGALAFIHGWLAAFLTSPFFAGFTSALYHAWGGDN